MVNAALPAALRACGERAVRWSLQPEGLRPVSAGVQVARVLRGAHPGAIVDLHDAEGTPGAPARLVEALPRMIDGLRAAGYAFTTVGELLIPHRRGGHVRERRAVRASDRCRARKRRKSRPSPRRRRRTWRSRSISRPMAMILRGRK